VRRRDNNSDAGKRPVNSGYDEIELRPIKCCSCCYESTLSFLLTLQQGRDTSDKRTICSPIASPAVYSPCSDASAHKAISQSAELHRALYTNGRFTQGGGSIRLQTNPIEPVLWICHSHTQQQQAAKLVNEHQYESSELGSTYHNPLSMEKRLRRPFREYPLQIACFVCLLRILSRLSDHGNSLLCLIAVPANVP
jgi:hypothetical protein